MEFIDVIDRRRTIRDFSDRIVPFGIIQSALEAGLKAPSYNHLKEWYFVLVEDRGARLSVIEAEGRSGIVSEEARRAFEAFDPLASEMYLDAIPKQNKMLLTASGVLVMVYKPKTNIGEGKTVADYNCLAAAWCCIENILLSLATEDVYATTLVPENTHKIKEALGIPQNLEVAALIPFGYKAEDAKMIPQKEATVESRLHRDKW